VSTEPAHAGALPRRLLVLLGALSAMGALSIDIYLPALPGIARALHTGTAEAQLTLGAFFIGIAGGQLLCGPLSDRFGRRPVLLAGVALYAVASALCASAQSIETLIGWRLVQGVAASAGAVVARAVVRDVCTTDAAARALSVIFLVMLTAPLLAPAVGAQILGLAGWRAIFWTLAAFGAACLAVATAALPETHHGRAADGLRGALASYAAVLRNRRSVGFTLTGAAYSIGFFAYLSGSPFVYIETYGVDPQTYAYLFAVNVLGIMAATFVNGRLVGHLGAERMLSVGVSVAAIGGLTVLGVVWTGLGGLTGLVASLLIFVSTIGLVAANSTASALAPFPHAAGAGSALIGATQFATGALAGIVLGRLADGTALPLAALIAISGIACAAARAGLTRPDGGTDGDRALPGPRSSSRNCDSG